MMMTLCIHSILVTSPFIRIMNRPTLMKRSVKLHENIIRMHYVSAHNCSLCEQKKVQRTNKCYCTDMTA